MVRAIQFGKLFRFKYFVARSKAVYAQDLLCVLKPFLFMHKISTRVTKW